MTDGVPSQRSHRVVTPAIILLLCLIALITRVEIFGNPIVYTDEEFYLLVGDRMLHGALPYVDLWDRKPIGLFLLYAAARTLGGNGVFAYQILGTIFAVGTATLIVKVASEFSNRWGAVASGIAYLVWLNLGSAGGGQSPLFYNLFVCAAGMLTLRAVGNAAAARANIAVAASLQRKSQPSLFLGLTVMLLMGLAIQVKYSAVFEGIFFGFIFLFLFRECTPPAALVLKGLSMIGVALLPTLLASAAYVSLGYGHAFFFANFVSIFERGGQASGARLFAHLIVLLLILAPLVIASAVRLPLGRDAVARAAHRFVLQWLAVALFALVMFGTYLQSYLLPVLVPAAAGGSVLFERKRTQPAITALIAIALVIGNIKVAVDIHKRGTAESFEQMVSSIDPQGCLFVYSGEPAFYHATAACIPTRFAFPSHLARLGESGALGVNPKQEVDRILRTHPETVIVSQTYNDEDTETREMVLLEMSRHYGLIQSTRLGQNAVEIFRLRPPESEASHPQAR